MYKFTITRHRPRSACIGVSHVNSIWLGNIYEISPYVTFMGKMNDIRGSGVGTA